MPQSETIIEYYDSDDDEFEYVEVEEWEEEDDASYYYVEEEIIQHLETIFEGSEDEETSDDEDDYEWSWMKLRGNDDGEQGKCDSLVVRRRSSVTKQSVVKAFYTYSAKTTARTLSDKNSLLLAVAQSLNKSLCDQHRPQSKNKRNSPPLSPVRGPKGVVRATQSRQQTKLARAA